MDNADSSSEPAGPQPIRHLQESLINRIAAGEIIHRPSSALKELIENSLDAGATSIRVTIKDGGLKLLQIQDNGCGIRKSDLPILAERFTTSKLSTFSDLQSLRTYGFRGEALASISHVAQLSVITKTKTDSCAYKAHYLDGRLTSAKPGQSADPKPCAGNDGTTITAENLFYNTPTRLAALRSSSEEYARILDVVTRYAVHNSTVSFVCKKAGTAGPDISTPSNSTTKQAIRLLYGQTIARELLDAKFSSGARSADEDSMDVDNDDAEEGSWHGEALFTSANYQAKKTVFLLFINHRLVESTRIKRAIESVYSTILPKGTFPFVYLSLEIDPRAVDVNVHPTKREVHFLDEESIISCVSDEIQHTLADQGRSRTFEYQTQTLLTGGILDVNQSVKKGKGKEKAGEEDDGSGNDEEAVAPSGTISKQKTVYSKDKIRVSQADRKLDSMLPMLDPATQASATQFSSMERDRDKYRSRDNSSSSLRPTQTPAANKSQRLQDIPESECYLTSLNGLRSDVEKAQHNFLTEIVQKHVFVGIVDLRRSLSLIQHETKLYLLNHASLAEELFYQLGLRQFGNYARLKLEPPPPIRHLVRLAVRTENERWKECGLDIEADEVVERIVTKLTENAGMLNEYFSMRITPEGTLASLPLLLQAYIPDLARLPLFLMRLGPRVCWTQERECFNTFLRELAYFYSPADLSISQKGKGPEKVDGDDPGEKRERWQIEHVLFPAMRKYLLAPRNLLDRDVLQVANLPDLYRVFERC
ncbi:MLH1 [Sanghuangporus weigelae]